jgi:hypothetical protein
MRFDLDIHYVRKTREGGKKRANMQEMWRIGHYMVKVKSKFSIFVIRAQKDKGIVLFKNFDNTCKGFKMKQTSTTKKILV